MTLLFYLHSSKQVEFSIMEAKHDANLKRVKSEAEMEFEKKIESQIEDFIKRHSAEEQRKNEEYKNQLAQVCSCLYLLPGLILAISITEPFGLASHNLIKPDKRRHKTLICILKLRGKRFCLSEKQKLFLLIT